MKQTKGKIHSMASFAQQLKDYYFYLHEFIKGGGNRNFAKKGRKLTKLSFYFPLRKTRLSHFSTAFDSGAADGEKPHLGSVTVSCTRRCNLSYG